MWLARVVYLLLGVAEGWGGRRGHAYPCAVLGHAMLRYSVGVGLGVMPHTIPYMPTAVGFFSPGPKGRIGKWVGRTYMAHVPSIRLTKLERHLLYRWKK